MEYDELRAYKCKTCERKGKEKEYCFNCCWRKEYGGANFYVGR